MAKKNKIQFQKGMSMSDFMNSYGTEEQCVAALVKVRWPSGFECPKCSHKKSCQLKSRSNLFQCNSCRSQVSVTAGTIFHSTKLPLTKWFLGIHLITQGKNGISQLELARQLGISANAAATMYHKLAQVMLERDAAKPLGENIEIDDAYWDGKKAGKRGRGSDNKIPFVAAIEKNKDGHPMRIKLSVVAGFKRSEIKGWAEKHILEGSTAVSDGLACFKGLEDAGLTHKAIVVGNSKIQLIQPHSIGLTRSWGILNQHWREPITNFPALTCLDIWQPFSTDSTDGLSSKTWCHDLPMFH